MRTDDILQLISLKWKDKKLDYNPELGVVTDAVECSKLIQVSS